MAFPVPPSINAQYATVNGRRVLSAAGRAYKQIVAHHILVALSRFPHRAALLRTLRGDALALTLRFEFATPLRRDVDGGLKITQDALCEALGLNDNRIIELHLYKGTATGVPRVLVDLAPTGNPGLGDADPGSKTPGPDSRIGPSFRS